ncbi:MAG: hypothetical protein WCJ29_04060 [bacterium]
MKLILQNPAENARNILRSAGYSEYTDRNTQKTSFAKRLGPDLFPKFHVYATESDGHIAIDIHIDQKQVSYEGSVHMHSGEYEGANIERELARIEKVASQIKPAAQPKKTGFFASIFGGDEE